MFSGRQSEPPAGAQPFLATRDPFPRLQHKTPAQAGKTSPHTLACSSISLAENCNSQIGHWTQEGGGELSGEDTHSTDSEEDEEAGEAGWGGELSPQVAACLGRVSMLKEPAQMGHCPAACTPPSSLLV